MFICGCPGVRVTALIKDMSALMFYSSFMRQPYLNYLSALILYVHTLVYVHNCLASVINRHKHSFELSVAYSVLCVLSHFHCKLCVNFLVGVSRQI